eukprot:m.196012 g.196012  ORF g.196012 m.196012 type:complete len:70 (-) comp18317_c0_seq1:155-364(-)
MGPDTQLHDASECNDEVRAVEVVTHVLAAAKPAQAGRRVDADENMLAVGAQAPRTAARQAAAAAMSTVG